LPGCLICKPSDTTSTTGMASSGARSRGLSHFFEVQSRMKPPTANASAPAITGAVATGITENAPAKTMVRKSAAGRA
jgi:hypothetical protein